MVTPWIIDAKDLDSASLSDDFNTALLLRNEHVNQFLDPSNRGRFLVVAPKGYGKTLLLKGRRLAFQGREVRALPENALVERPVGTPHVISARAAESLAADPHYWKTAWTLALTLCCIKASKAELETKCAPLLELARERRLKHACDLFARLLQLRHREFSRAQEALGRDLIPTFREINEPMMLFVDNIDEYFQDFLSEHGGTFLRNVTSDAWNHAQAGLALAARELHGINPHVRIYASIRKEVMQLLGQTYAMSQQLRGSAVDLAYTDEDLLEIIRLNIRAERRDRLVQPDASDELERFVGPESLRLRNELTLEDEDLPRFWLRHTLRRPRDVVEVGQSLSAVPPASRTPDKVREAIRSTARLIAGSYLSEIRPHLERFDEDILFPLLPTNVLSQDILHELSAEYDRRFREKHGLAEESAHVFSNLYRVGLLGYVRAAANGRSEQVFPLPGEQPFGPAHILPDASFYLLHPVLDDLVAQHDGDWSTRLDTHNIIERGRVFRRARPVGFVLLGDVVDYSSIMRDAELKPRFRETFARMVDEASRGLAYACIEAGDQVTLIDGNPLRLFEAARRLHAALSSSVFARGLRYGGEAGVFELSGLGPGAPPPDTTSLITAARVLARARPGAVLLAEGFRAELDAGGWPERSLRPLLPADRPDIPHDGERFSVEKPGGTDAVRTALFELGLEEL